MAAELFVRAKLVIGEYQAWQGLAGELLDKTISVFKGCPDISIIEGCEIQVGYTPCCDVGVEVPKKVLSLAVKVLLCGIVWKCHGSATIVKTSVFTKASG